MSSAFGTGRVAYPGLRAFGREEFDLFFGRESCVDEMVDTLGRTCFLAVLGTSGSGKSSLVRTGLLNALELGFLASAGSTWRIAELRPRGHPIRSLAVALLGLQGVEKPDEAEIEILSAFLRRGPRSLVEWASGGHLPQRANLMVLVDQFEELFRYEDYSGREEAEAFVGLLVTAARANAPIYIAITMRSEYLGACTLIEGLPEVINRGLYLTPRMSRDECRQAIVGPAEVCGFRIEDRLVNKLLNDLTDFAPWEAGGGHDQQRRLGRRADQLPLMQHVLNLLWQKARVRSETDIVLTLADYEAAGGLGGALDRHADDIATTVPPEYAEAIDPVFRSLVTGRTVADAVRRPTRFGDLVELAGGSRDAVAAVVDAFRAQGVNFLTPGQPDPIDDDSFIDISHESLIRQWRRLSRCLDEEAHSADAWHQLLSRSERYKAGAGGLLTGLDLDNLVDWWERTKPTAAWANRYGNNFEEAGKYLRDSQFAEADLKRREEEEERKLIAAEEAASSGRRFKRLAVALAAALIVAFAATGAAFYLWREANADALAADIARAEAEEAKLEADNQRAIAETARAEAEEQRIIAEAEAEAAETARAEAEEQRIIAEAARLEAERARTAAETARQEAIAARQQADQIIDTSIAYFAKSLGDEVASIHSDPNLAPELSYAGGLLSRLAADTQAEGASGADVGFMDVLRPTFVVQDALTSAYVPAMGSGPSDVTWSDPKGGPGLVAVMDLTGKKLRITDRTGRIVALYEIPASFWGALADTPFAAVRGGDGAPIAVIADTAGDIWIGSGGLGPLQVVGNGANEFGQIDDLSFDPASGKIAIAYSVETVTGERRGDRGQARLGSLLNVAVIENNVGGWRIVGSSRLPRGPLGSESGPVRLAGALGDLIFAVAEGAVVAIDVEASSASAIDMPVPVIDAGMTEDGRFLLAGALRNADGQCSDASGTQGFLEPWFRRDPEAPVKAGLAVIDPDDTDQGETRAAPDVPDAACLILVDIGSGDPLWQGTASAARFDSLRGVAGVEAVEFVEGPTANDLRVRRIFQAPEGWTDSAIDFDQNDWGLTGFSETYAAVAATDAAFPLALTPDLVDRRIKDGILRRIASPPPGGRIVASRIAGDEVQIARIPAGADPFGGETALEVLVYRPEAGQYVRDDRIDTNGAACLASGQDGSCRFDAAAFSPNGDWLLLVSSGNHVFVGRSGMLGGWQTTIPEETGAAAIPQDGRATRSQTLQGGDKGGPVEKAEGVGTEVLPEDVGKGTGVGGGAGPGAFLASVLPLDAEGRSFVGRSGLDGGLWRVVRLGGTGGSGSSRTSVTPIDLPRQIAAGMTGIATDPERSTIYVWGPRIGLRMISGESSGMAEAAFEFDSPLADVAPLPSGGVVVATTDGDVMVIPPDRFRLSGSGSAGNAAVESPASVDTGLGRFGAMDVWAGSDRVVVSAGTPTPEGVDNAPAAAPAPEDETDRARLRAVGFAVDGDGALQLTFIAPWERIDGQLANGEAVSLSTGEILGEPPPLPDDETLLALTIMREQQHTQETPEFEIGFDMLHMRVAGDAEDGVRVSSCEWILTTAVRMGGDLQQNIGEDVRRACDEPAATAPVVNAIFDDRNDQRTSALLRYAPANPLALAVLISNLRQVAPAAAEVLASSYRAAQYDQWESALAAIAEGGPLPLATAGADAAVFDPFAHWVLAMEGERTGGNAETLAESLFHYAYAERLFRTARFRTPEQIVKRRIALARSLSDDVVYDVFQRLQASPVNPDDASSGQELVSVPLHDIRQWLVEIGGSDPEAAKRLDVLVAPVEEMMGDELASTDPEAAAGHYWKAISLVASAGESLSQRPGVLGRIDKVQELGGKLAAAGSSMALPDTSGAVLGIIDAALTQPVRRDIDPPELRPAIASAFEDLAEAGAEGYDLSRFRDLGLRFLDFDWESRFQSINQVGAERFYRELTAAEAFLTAALATASDEDRLHWLALRGRMRFWLSTIDGESVPVDGAVLRDWLDGALADYDAAGGPEKLGLWDATIVGGANSRMIELVGSEAEVAGYVAKASAAFRHAIDRHGDSNGVIGGDGKPEDFLDLDQYRRRLAYDGYVLALERAIIWLRGDRFLSGVEAQPGDPDYNRGRLADIGYAALSYARQREALRAEAEVNGLFEKNSTWSLDTFGDFYWGSTVAQMGALLRIEDGVNGSPNLCDRLAAHPYDVTRPTAAVDYDALDVDAVLDACDDGAARSLYHQARALSKAATVSPDEILRLLLPSAREQLPIAYNNISILVSDAGGTPEEAQALVSTFSELSLITAYPQIALLLREEQKSAERAETFEWLARKAAALGVPEAYLDIAELTPDVLTRTLNYTIARDLYAEAGRSAEAEAMQAKLDAVNLSATNVSSLAAQAANRARVTPRLLDDALIKRIEDLLWDARSQASLR